MPSPLKYLSKCCGVAVEPAIILSSLKVAVVVGIILNLINQWEAIVTWNTQEISWLKLLMTFCVPYAVSTYASVVTAMRKKV